MTEPTLTELREMARRTVTRRHHESEEGMLAAAFLSLTDHKTRLAEQSSRLTAAESEVREMAADLVNHCKLQSEQTGGLSMAEEYGRRVAESYLSLTDQLAAVTAERDRLQQRLDAAPVWFVGRRSLERNDVAPQLFSRQVSLVGGKTIPVRLIQE